MISKMGLREAASRNTKAIEANNNKKIGRLEKKSQSAADQPNNLAEGHPPL
jgi:hypothetical protein